MKRIVVLAACAALGLGSCGSVGSQGPIRHVCGQIVSTAGGAGGPEWFLDASLTTATVELYESPAGLNRGTWVQVSRDCANGATVSRSGSQLVRVDSSVKATSGGYVALHLSGHAIGSTELTVRDASGPAHIVVVRVVREPPVPASAVPSGVTHSP